MRQTSSCPCPSAIRCSFDFDPNFNAPAGFHRADGMGYAFWAERVLELDPLNPQVATA